ncbi:DUF2489 domain-containing protein [Paraglaciecola sp. 2405UD69-4]|uniref:DUF2489 domain-containing protein n=1 Tax=Paraglaciecola sp. 2405UD69-4 TaxID=3391836 RepID=UPI0039C9B0A8
MIYLLLISALVIIAGLAFYAGSLLFKLKAQTLQKEKTTQKRVENIVESIQTIALAIEQQQCNLSEGCIRLTHLLECLPIADKPDFKAQYPGLYELYAAVEHLPTHEKRKAQSKQETWKQDLFREEIEAKLSSKIMAEVSSLSKFTLKS